MKINLEHDRSNLNEGRTYGMGFGFLKKIDEETFETVMPISPCKDYLNDALYAEKTGKVLPEIYGFKYQGVGNISDEEYFYIGIKFCTSDKYSKYEEGPLEAISSFKDNHKNVESFMNQLETILGLEVFTKIELAEDNLFLLKMPLFWTEKLYLLSLYTLLVRAYQDYDKSLPAEEYIKKGKPYREDTFMINDKIRDKISIILKKEAPEQSWNDFEGNQRKVHNSGGIVSFKF